MKTIIKLYNIFGPEIGVRRTISDFGATLKSDTDYLLDFDGITLISRSVADEFFNIVSTHSNVHYVRMASNVQKMYDIVSISRFSPRQRQEIDSNIVECSTMNQVRQCFATLCN